MITRLWRWWTASEDADAYERFLLTELFPSMREIPGFRGAEVLRRSDGGEVTFVTLTRFDSLRRASTPLRYHFDTASYLTAIYDEPPLAPRKRHAMIEGIRSRATYANVTATLALFVALGGTGAYAAAKIGAGDIKKNAVRSKHVKNGTIDAKDINKKTRASWQGTPGPAGPAGGQGPAGPKGDTGPAGAPATKYFASVATDGSLYGRGTATAATHEGTGTYNVTFGDADLTGCTPVANVGYGPGASGPSYSGNTGAVFAFIAASGTDTNRVQVLIGDDNPATSFFTPGGKRDNSFHLAVFC